MFYSAFGSLSDSQPIYIALIIFGIITLLTVFSAVKRKRATKKFFEEWQSGYFKQTNQLNQQYSQLPYTHPQQQAAEPLPVSDDELFRRMAAAREDSKRQSSVLVAVLAVSIPLFFLFAPLGMLILIGGIFFLIKKSRAKEYAALYKENIVRKALARQFQNLSYSPFTGLHPGQIRNTGLIKLGQSFNSEDYIKGTHLGIDFEQADVYTYTKGDDSQTTYFKGRWVVLRLNKNISSVLCVYDKRFPYYKSAPSMSYDLQKVELEDVAFNEKYRVISSDPHSAFYVLTPQVMSNLSKITAYMSRGGHMPLAFFMFGNEVHIAVHNAQNAFELSASEPLDRGYMEQKIANEVQLITDVINIFTKYF